MDNLWFLRYLFLFGFYFVFDGFVYEDSGGEWMIEL